MGPISISDSCVGCGACVKDCIRGCLEHTPDGIRGTFDLCNRCGHCVAVCPVGAVAMTDAEEACEEQSPVRSRLENANILLELMRFRRSVRQFSNKPVDINTVRRVIEAGRVAPTACNFQTNRFLVVQEKRQELLRILLKQLAKDARKVLSSDAEPLLQFRARQWVDMYKANEADPTDLKPLFFNAPVVLLLVAPDVRDGGIAASYIELMAAAEGLGTLYSGYISAAVNSSQEARAYLGIQENEQVVIGILMGHPAVRYYRNAPRKPPQVTVF